MHSPTTLNKKIRPDLLPTGVDGSTITMECHFSESARKRSLTPSMKAKRCAFAKPQLNCTTFKIEGRYRGWIAVLLNFSFSDILLFEYPSSCNVIIFYLSTPDFLSIFSAVKLATIFTILISKTTRLCAIKKYLFHCYILLAFN